MSALVVSAGYKGREQADRRRTCEAYREATGGLSKGAHVQRDTVVGYVGTGKGKRTPMVQAPTFEYMYNALLVHIARI